MENTPPQAARLVLNTNVLKVALILVTTVLVAGWLWKTPPGLFGKADALAYAVCHRIAERSFVIGDRQTPLCARCTGMFLGAVLGIIYLSRYGRRAGLPPLKILVVLGAFLAAFGLDGANSYLHFFPGAPGLYQPENWLRLLTGTGVGMAIALVLVPVVHQTLWQTYDSRPAVAGWRQFLPLVGLGGLLDLVILSDNQLLLYPLALLSAAGIILVLSMVYLVVWIMLTKRENHFQSYRGLWMPLLTGFLTAMIQIALLDAGRFWLTGTWAGFKF